MATITENAGAVVDMAIWTIYDHPRDYPAHYVARRWELRRGDENPHPTDDVLLAEHLDELRRLLPPGLSRFPCVDRDDPCIVETWL